MYWCTYVHKFFFNTFILFKVFSSKSLNKNVHTYILLIISCNNIFPKKYPKEKKHSSTYVRHENILYVPYGLILVYHQDRTLKQTRYYKIHTQYHSSVFFQVTWKNQPKMAEKQNPKMATTSREYQGELKKSVWGSFFFWSLVSNPVFTF